MISGSSYNTLAKNAPGVHTPIHQTPHPRCAAAQYSRRSPRTLLFHCRTAECRSTCPHAWSLTAHRVPHAPPRPLTSSYNVAPTAVQPVYRLENSSASACSSSIRLLQPMRWGLLKSNSLSSPRSRLNTFNCRGDTLLENSSPLWRSCRRHRCVVLADGYYEWQKRGSAKLPHYTKRKDGQLMLFAALYNCTIFPKAHDPLYTYTIITTHSRSDLVWLHHRMPVILENGSDSMWKWLNCAQEWSNDYENILVPSHADLDCYPVKKDVGKVKNNDPSLIIPLDSKENKSNIANFFKLDSDHNSQKPDCSEIENTNSETNAPLPHAKPQHAKRKTPGLNQSSTDKPKPKMQKTISIVKSSNSLSTLEKQKSINTDQESKSPSSKTKKLKIIFEATSPKITNFFEKS